MQRFQDALEKTKRDIEWRNNTANLEDLVRTVEKRNKRQKSKAILYIVIGVGMMLFLVARLMRKNAEKKVNGQ